MEPWTSIIGVVGTLSGTALGYYISSKIAKDSAKNSASRALMDAFKEELLALDPAKHSLEEGNPVFLE